MGSRERGPSCERAAPPAGGLVWRSSTPTNIVGSLADIRIEPRPPAQGEREARAEAGVQGGLGLGLGLGLRLSGPGRGAGLGLGLGAGRGAALGAGRGAGLGRGAGRGRGAPLSPLSPLGRFLPSFFLGLGSFLGFLPSFFFFPLPTFKLEDESLWRMLPRPS